MRSKAERSEMPVMMPGSAIGRTKSSEIASRPKNFARDKRRGGRACRGCSASAVDDRRDPSESVERRPDIGPVPGDAEPFGVSPGGGNWKLFSSVVKA